MIYCTFIVSRYLQPSQVLFHEFWPRHGPHFRKERRHLGWNSWRDSNVHGWVRVSHCQVSLGDKRCWVSPKFSSKIMDGLRILKLVNRTCKLMVSFRECNSGFVKGFSDSKNGLLHFGLANYSSYRDGPVENGSLKTKGFHFHKGNKLWWLSIDKQSFKQKWKIIISNVGELV